MHIKAGVARENAAVLSVIGGDVDGTKLLIALEEGYRRAESCDCRDLPLRVVTELCNF